MVARVNPPRITACRSCVQPCFWVETMPNRKAMLMNAEPSASGTFTLKERPDDVPLAFYVGNTVTELDRYTSHFSTCPQAGSFRKKK